MNRPSIFLLAAALALPALPASAQQTTEQNLFQGLLSGLGILPSERPAIDYRERAPLVVPRNTTQLPPPQAPAAQQRNPNWPNDPDVARARAAAANANAPIVTPSPERTLTNGEMRAQSAGGWFGGGVVDTTRQRSEEQIRGPATAAEMGVRPLWEQVGAVLNQRPDREERIAFTGEQPRRRLVEPPPGYRTPSPDAPFGPLGRRPDDPAHAANRDRVRGEDPTRNPNAGR